MSLFKKFFFSFLLFGIIIANLGIVLFFKFVSINYVNNIKKTLVEQANLTEFYIQAHPKLNKLYKTSNNLVIFVEKSTKPISAKFIKLNNFLYFQTYFNNHIIIVGKPLSELTNFNKAYVKAFIIVNIFVIFFSALLAYLISKGLFKPIQQIINGLQNYKLGEKINLPETSDKDLNLIISKIKQFIDTLNQNYQKEKEFIQEISHEIKTPLMQILSTVELSNLEQNQINFINERINYISDLLEKLSFLQQSTEKLNLTPINLVTYLQNFVKKYEKLIQSKNIDLNLSINAEPKIKANEYYLDRLFGNLITNAIKYTKPGGKINIVVNKNNVIVKDTGVGIKKENLNKIFEKFYKGNESQGLGLGLAIVKKIVEILGWKIIVNSKINEGTEFIIKF